MARITNTWWNNKTQLAVSMDGLSYHGERKMHFVLICNYRDVSFADSDNTSGEANVIFDVSSVPDGNQYFMVKRIMEGTGNRFLVGDFTKYVGGGGSIIEPDDPPSPTYREMTYIKLKRFIYVEEDYVKVEIETNGYGDVYLVSVSKGWDLYSGQLGASQEIDSTYISKGSLDSQGYFYGTVSFSPRTTDMSYFPSIPIGTCYLASDRSITGAYYGVHSTEFLCLSQYGKWTTYEGIYQTTLQQYNYGFSANVLSLSTVKDDWNRLVNMSFYLEATTWGDIKYAQYANYIPRSGDIITASMYNGLLDAVRRCGRRIGVPTGGLPSYVSENQIIPKDFIQEIGSFVDRCLVTQRTDVNNSVLRRQ